MITNRSSHLEIFRAGYDAFQVKTIKRISEPMALKLITLERSAALGLPNPYQSPPKQEEDNGEETSQRGDRSQQQ